LSSVRRITVWKPGSQELAEDDSRFGKVSKLQKKVPNALKSLDAELKSAPVFSPSYAAANAALDEGRREIFLADNT
jgi:hypothetical protein